MTCAYPCLLQQVSRPNGAQVHLSIATSISRTFLAIGPTRTKQNARGTSPRYLLSLARAAHLFEQITEGLNDNIFAETGSDSPKLASRYKNVGI